MELEERAHVGAVYNADMLVGGFHCTNPSLIIGPVFFSAWDYTLLGMCIRHLGPQYSLLGPKWYIIVFVIADIVSLVLQAIGGGGAAVQAQNYEDTDKNTRISELWT